MNLKSLAPAVLLLASLALAQKAAAPAVVKAGDLLKSGAKYDAKVVTVTGKVAKYQARTSKAGNAYLTFDLIDGGSTVHIYSHGTMTPAPKDGARVRVTGKFAVLKKMGTREFKNEIDASPARGAKDGKPAIVVVK